MAPHASSALVPIHALWSPWTNIGLTSHCAWCVYRTEEPLVLPCSFLLLLTLTIAIQPTNLFNTLCSSPLHPSPLPLAKCVSGHGFIDDKIKLHTYFLLFTCMVLLQGEIILSCKLLRRLGSSTSLRLIRGQLAAAANDAKAVFPLIILDQNMDKTVGLNKLAPIPHSAGWISTLSRKSSLEMSIERWRQLELKEDYLTKHEFSLALGMRF